MMKQAAQNNPHFLGTSSQDLVAKHIGTNHHPNPLKDGLVVLAQIDSQKMCAQVQSNLISVN